MFLLIADMPEEPAVPEARMAILAAEVVARVVLRV
jgi:hypothetical protein